jgi:glycerophosphoryl diester phosphodiesterase
MKSTLDPKIVGMPIPVISAHAGGKGSGKENHLTTIQESLKSSYDEIEVDVRKSHDGIVYCHHGSVPFGVILSQILHWFPYLTILRMLGATSLLAEIVPVIPSEIGLYLDVKESQVTAEDLKKALKECRATRIWIACYSHTQLASIKEQLGDGYIYVFNTPYVSPSKAGKKYGNTADIIANTIPQLLLEYLPQKLAHKLARHIHHRMPIWLVHSAGSSAFFVYPQWLWVAYDTPQEMAADLPFREWKQNFKLT